VVDQGKSLIFTRFLDKGIEINVRAIEYFVTPISREIRKELFDRSQEETLTACASSVRKACFLSSSVGAFLFTEKSFLVTTIKSSVRRLRKENLKLSFTVFSGQGESKRKVVYHRTRCRLVQKKGNVLAGNRRKYMSSNSLNISYSSVVNSNISFILLLTVVVFFELICIKGREESRRISCTKGFDIIRSWFSWFSQNSSSLINIVLNAKTTGLDA
jgi:hypothetical protein